MSDEAVNDPNKLRQIYMFRMINGQRLRWVFEVDSTMLVVREGPADPGQMSKNFQAAAAVVGSHAQIDQKRKEEALASYKASLDERGIKYTVNDNGQIIITSRPEKEMQIMQFLDVSAAGCPDVPGMPELRAAYMDEYKTLGGSACPGCQLNTLQRKYRNLLNEKVFKANG